MTLARASTPLMSGAAYITRIAAQLAARLRELPTSWHHVIRGLSVALVLWVAGAAAVDRVVAAGNRGRGVAAVESASGPAPVVAKLQMKKPFSAGPTVQVIPVTGTNFAAGMTARLISPMDEDTTTFPPIALERLSPTSFELRTALETPGTYELSVRTPDGQRSNSISILVKK